MVNILIPFLLGCVLGWYISHLKYNRRFIQKNNRNSCIQIGSINIKEDNE